MQFSEIAKKIFTKENGLKVFIFLAALGLTLDYALVSLDRPGLCSTKDCRIVGGFLKFPEIYLILAGACFFWFLWVLIFFACRYKKKILWWLPALGLLSAMAFDGGLLGYQFLGLKLNCWLCIAVGAALFLACAGFAWVKSYWTFLLVGILVWSSAFAASSILIVKPKTPKLSETAFMRAEAKDKEAGIEMYLFFSLHCGHCSRVLFNLAIAKPSPKISWNFCSLDSQEKDLQKLAYALNKMSEVKNPFAKILKVESEKEKKFRAEVPDDLREHIENAKFFCRARHYSKIPILIAIEGAGREVVNTGVNNIARYLWQRKIIKRWVNPKTVQQSKPKKSKSLK